MKPQASNSGRDFTDWQERLAQGNAAKGRREWGRKALATALANTVYDMPLNAQDGTAITVIEALRSQNYLQAPAIDHPLMDEMQLCGKRIEDDIAKWAGLTASTRTTSHSAVRSALHQSVIKYTALLKLSGQIREGGPGQEEAYQVTDAGKLQAALTLEAALAEMEKTMSRANRRLGGAPRSGRGG